MKRTTPAMAGVLVLFLALGVIYSLVTPVFEASDELWHYPVVKHIADGSGLPVQDPASPAMWNQEGSQPPLYYALAALVTAWIDTDDLGERLWYNPHANVGKPLAPGNKNMIVHTDREAFPWRGTTLAVHLIRWLSVLLQAFTVWLTYLIAREVAPGRRDLATAAAALVAFNPMFLFISGSVNNDNLVAPLAAFALWLLVRTLRQGWITPVQLVALGVTLGLAALTKLSGALLMPLAAVVLTIVAARKRAWRAWVVFGAVLGLLVAAIAGWWYVRNWQLYGDPTGLNVMLAIAGRRPAPLSPGDLLAEFQGFRMSYWGVFGGFNVTGSVWLYRLYDALSLIGLAGWIPLVLRYRERLRTMQASLVALLVAWTALVFVFLVRWTLQTAASQGRLLFPAIGAVAVVLSYGLAGWLPQRWHAPAWAGAGGVLLATAAAVPLLVIAPAYARPPLLRVDQVPATAIPLDLVFDGSLRLLGYELPQDTVHPGETAPVTLYWQSVAPTQENLVVFIHAVERSSTIGQVDSYPGLGAWPTSLLPTGAVLKDTYHIPIVETATAPAVLRLDVGSYRFSGSDPSGLELVDSNGLDAGSSLGTVRLLPLGSPDYAIANPMRFDFGEQVALLGYDLPSVVVRPGQDLALTLYWEAQTRITDEYQVFVHLLGAEPQPAAQGDQAPFEGAWPTWAWEPGMALRDKYRVSLPSALAPGLYELRVGLYRTSDGWRPPVVGPEGRVRDDSAIIGRVEVR
mgnify:CR=1 FL=1